MALWPGMSERERRLLGGGLVLAAFISTLLFVDVPLYRSGRDMERKAAAEQSRLKSIIAMGQEYLSVKDEVDEIRGKAFNGAGTSLSGIDAIVGKSGLKKKMASLKPTTNPVAEGIKAIKAEVAFERISRPGQTDRRHGIRWTSHGDREDLHQGHVRGPFRLPCHADREYGGTGVERSEQQRHGPADDAPRRSPPLRSHRRHAQQKPPGAHEGEEQRQLPQCVVHHEVWSLSRHGVSRKGRERNPHRYPFRGMGPRGRALPGGEGTVSIRIGDEALRFNINTLVTPQGKINDKAVERFGRLLRSVGSKEALWEQWRSG